MRTKIMNNITQGEEAPEQWAEEAIIKTHKKILSGNAQTIDLYAWPK